MSVAEMTEQDQITTRQEALERRVLLICPILGWWKGMYQLPTKKTEITSDGKTVNKKDVTTPRAKMMTDTYPTDREGKSWKKRFNRIDSRLEALKHEFSVKFPITGVRIIPKSRGREFMSRMYGLTLRKLKQQLANAEEAQRTEEAETLRNQIATVLNEHQGEDTPDNTPVWDPDKGSKITDQSIAYQLHVAAKEFCDDWPRIREELSQKNSVFAEVAHKVPAATADIRHRFYLDVVPVELASNAANELTQDDLVEHSQIVQDACRRRVDEAIDEMISGPRQQLAEALASLHELIQRDGRVTQKSFGPVRAAIAKIRMFDFVANDTMLESIKQLENRLNITQPTSLDSVTAANNGFSDAIETFMNEVQDEDRAAEDSRRFGREFRAIDLD